ncbi:MAG: 23S rRNA (pseudouridine(1915)-N(3))-methyltransferase RlmH [Prevotellaceae bacterium]|jgi:23S rRNA (pseudouridine1915-N3)-methyltransferase|nr:23S rRNA (pseudouridine(1915)-N(3))-methyltransferase RlmH [Prevotellaceae bacterium]
MKIKLIITGETSFEWLSQAVEMYSKRIKRYANFDIKYIADVKNTKNMTTEIQKGREGELIMSMLDAKDSVVLLDEHGEDFSSVQFAGFINGRIMASTKSLVFVIGGAYGFSQDVYRRADTKLSLSKMTFSHQSVRLVFIEQLYRAFTIINGEPYHHE